MIKSNLQYPDTGLNRIKKTFLTICKTKGLDEAGGYLFSKFFGAPQDLKKELIDFANEVRVQLSSPPWNPSPLKAELNLEHYKLVNV